MSLRKTLKDLGRSVVGALLLGLPLLYTMETWWLGWRLPALVLGLYAGLGLLLVFVVVRFVGFRPEEEDRKTPPRELVRDFLELVFTSFVAAYAVLLLLGILELRSSAHDVIRLGLVQVVPLGLGAAVANRALHGSPEGEEDTTFHGEMATFALGAAFFALPVAPTEEMERIAAHAGWVRLAVMVLASIVVSYLALYELEFRGAGARARRLRSPWLKWGEVTANYVLALVVSALLLAAYGHFTEIPLTSMTQEVVVLGLLASLGGAAARVVV